MQEVEEAGVVTQVYSIYIHATAQAIWEAITQPEWNSRYGYQAEQEYELVVGGKYVARPNAMMKQMGLPDVMIDGEILEVIPAQKLVQTYRFLFNDATVKEGYSTLTWEIDKVHGNFCKLTLTHEMENMPQMAAMVSSTFSEQGAGGWGWILSDLKSLLETGKNMGE